MFFHNKNKAGNTGLNVLVNKVKKYFEETGVTSKLGDVDFYLLGGCVFGTLNDKLYEDIDVFFYDKEVAKNVTNTIIEHYNEENKHNTFISELYVTSNALTNFENKIQLISKFCGEPKKILNTIDISCSKIAYTSKNILIKGDGYSNIPSIDYNNFSAQTTRRLFKYYTKTLTEYNKKTINDLKYLCDYLYKNKYLEMPNYSAYDTEIEEDIESEEKYKKIHLHALVDFVNNLYSYCVDDLSIYEHILNIGILDNEEINFKYRYKFIYSLFLALYQMKTDSKKHMSNFVLENMYDDYIIFSLLMNSKNTDNENYTSEHKQISDKNVINVSRYILSKCDKERVNEIMLKHAESFI